MCCGHGLSCEDSQSWVAPEWLLGKLIDIIVLFSGVCDGVMG